jgi:hypothetical protein
MKSEISPVNFYFLSSGFCGTRFYHHVLRLARNAEVWHQPGHEEISEITDMMERRFDLGHDRFLQSEIAEFPDVQRRIDKRLALPWIYGDTLNWMRGLGYMLFKYIGPERLRLVQLVRHPVATCRSMLAHYRGAPAGSSDIDMAEEMARRWLHQYTCIRFQFEAIDDPAVCKTIRLEDSGLEQVRALYTFVGLEGFDEAAIVELFQDESMEVRHSHLSGDEAPASREELQAIWRLCRPLAELYGYEEDVGLFESAPSRPVLRVAAVRENRNHHSQPEVKLLGNRGLGLIVRCPSGMHYINQAGGPICFWLRAEGAYAPLAAAGEGSAGQKLFDHFHLRRNKTFMSAIRPEDADFIDLLLAQADLGFIRVNRSRIGETWDLFDWESWGEDIGSAPWEAWVPVKLARSEYSRLKGVVSGIETEDAILVWENSN